MFCRKCGFEIGPEDLFCENCGVKIEPRRSGSESGAPLKEKVEEPVSDAAEEIKTEAPADEIRSEDTADTENTIKEEAPVKATEDAADIDVDAMFKELMPDGAPGASKEMQAFFASLNAVKTAPAQTVEEPKAEPAEEELPSISVSSWNPVQNTEEAVNAAEDKASSSEDVNTDISAQEEKVTETVSVSKDTYSDLAASIHQLGLILADLEKKLERLSGNINVPQDPPKEAEVKEELPAETVDIQEKEVSDAAVQVVSDTAQITELLKAIQKGAAPVAPESESTGVVSGAEGTSDISEGSKEESDQEKAEEVKTPEGTQDPSTDAADTDNNLEKTGEVPSDKGPESAPEGKELTEEEALIKHYQELLAGLQDKKEEVSEEVVKSEEAAAEEKPKKKKRKWLKRTAGVLLILIIAAVLLATVGKETAVGAALRDTFNNVFGVKTESTDGASVEPPEEMVITATDTLIGQSIAKYIDQAKNITTVKEAPDLRFNVEKDYGVEGILDAISFDDDLWYMNDHSENVHYTPELVSFVMDYYSKLNARQNHDSDDVLKIIVPKTKLLGDVTAIKADPVIVHTYDLLEIGEIRRNKDDFYVMVRLTESTNDGHPSKKVTKVVRIRTYDKACAMAESVDISKE